MLRFAIILMCFFSSLSAAEIHMTDGQVIEGEIMARENGKVVVTFRAGRGTGTLHIPEDRIQEIKGDSSGSVAIESESSGMTGLMGQGKSFAGLRLSGRVGHEITARGLRAVFSAARKAKVGAVVFIIDSEGNGSAEEMAEIAEILERERDRFELHVLVRKCLGEALVFPLYSHNTEATVGAVMGAMPIDGEDPNEALARQEVAYRAGAVADRYGKPAAVWRALVDPSEEIAFWKDKNAPDGLRVGVMLPSNVPKEDIILVSKKEEQLTFTADHFMAAGLPQIDSEEAYRKAFGVEDWVNQGEVLEEAYTKALKIENERKAREETKNQRRIEKVLSRRETAEQTLAFSMEQISTWNPESGDYTTLTGAGSRRGWWRGGYAAEYGGGSAYSKNKGVMTPQARQNWRYRSDVTIGHLNNAIKAVGQLKSIERDAEKYHLQRAYSDVELKKMEAQLKQQREWYVRNRKNIEVAK